MTSRERNTRLYELEERVYGKFVTKVRMLPVPEAEKRRHTDAAMAVLCEVEAALASTQTGHAEAVLANAQAQLDALEREVDAQSR